jgi:hypothetical protein
MSKLRMIFGAALIGVLPLLFGLRASSPGHRGGGWRDECA